MAIILPKNFVTFLSIALFVALATSQAQAFLFQGKTTERIDATGQLFKSPNLLACNGCSPLANMKVAAVLNSTIPPTIIGTGTTGLDGVFSITLVEGLISGLLVGAETELSDILMFAVLPLNNGGPLGFLGGLLGPILNLISGSTYVLLGLADVRQDLGLITQLGLVPQGLLHVP